MAIAVANYVHPKYAVTESKVEQVTAIISGKELAERADREIAEAFREWKSPVIEHEAAPAETPTVSLQEKPSETETVVSRLPVRYRPPR